MRTSAEWIREIVSDVKDAMNSRSCIITISQHGYDRASLFIHLYNIYAFCLLLFLCVCYNFNESFMLLYDTQYLVPW